MSLKVFWVEYWGGYSIFEGVRIPPSILPPKDKTKRTKTIKAIASLRSQWRLEGCDCRPPRLWHVASACFGRLHELMIKTRSFAKSAQDDKKRASQGLKENKKRDCLVALLLAMTEKRRWQEECLIMTGWRMTKTQLYQIFHLFAFNLVVVKVYFGLNRWLFEDVSCG